MKILKWLALTPLILIGLAFAIANRHLTTVSFDPFNGNDISSPQITIPLFVVLFIATALGVVLGGVAVWLAQGRHRRAARAAKAEAENWRLEADRLRLQVASIGAAGPSQQPRALVRAY